MDAEKQYEGSRFNLYALVTDDGECSVVSFLESLTPADRKQIEALLTFTSIHGPPRNEEKSRKIEGAENLYEFKSFQDRILYFYDGRDEGGVGRIVMVNGFKHKDKRARRVDRAQLERAESLRGEYLDGRR